ncbi:MAG: DegT/DnrJ/EryC1/StrS family aminotransferase [Nitrospinae bacterium]|nr:DegT/DnrJ/EryC1/StrS family aminotransferase [Nitrospinota bacterium]
MKLELCHQEFSKEEISEVVASLTSGFVTMGDKVALFEKNFAEYIGVRHAVMVNSGSSANLLMVKALAKRLSPGDEVLLPALSWSTTFWPVVQSGLKPVLVDCDPETLNIGPEQLEEALQRHPSAKALIVAHIMGNPAPMKELQAVLYDHPMPILEDSCETLGSTYYGQKTGSFGVAGSFSFFYSHHMTTIEGGMIVTDDLNFAERCRVMRSHGWSRGLNDPVFRREVEALSDIDPRFLFIDEGYNLRPTELNAAIGIHQLASLDKRNTKRKIVNRKMMDIAREFSVDTIKVYEETDVALFAFPVMLENETERDALSLHLESNGIQTRPIVAGNLARHPGMAKHLASGLKLNGANKVSDCGLYWGLHPYVTDEQLMHLEKTLASHFKGVKAA